MPPGDKMCEIHAWHFGYRSFDATRESPLVLATPRSPLGLRRTIDVTHLRDVDKLPFADSPPGFPPKVHFTRR